ncbi:MAG TPA: C25 family cysteine peptidase [Rudaea sp.]|nr:C25 family cysteine peptidase [Rudaea sp.]
MTNASRNTARTRNRYRSVPTMLAVLLAGVAMMLPRPASACSGGLHVEIVDSAVYALDYEAIVAQQPGLADCPADALALRNGDNEVPIRIDGADGGFGPGARVEWIGQMRHGPGSWFDAYSNVNVYQLVSAPGAHARMHEGGGAAGGSTAPLQRSAHFEQENLLLRLNDRDMKPGEEPDVWQWAKLTPIDPQPFEWAFDLPDVDSAHGNAMAQLHLDFRGVSSIATSTSAIRPRDHVVEVSINGKILPLQTWDGRDEVRHDLAVPLASLKAKNNVIRVRVPTRDTPDGNFIVDAVMFNWFALDYPARGDIDAGGGAFVAGAAGTIQIEHRGSDAPELFDTGGGHRVAVAAGKDRWRAPADAKVEVFAVAAGRTRKPETVRAIAGGDLRTAEPGFDYLIIAHPRLLDAIQPLAQYHREHGLRVEVADVDAVYDQFNGGIAHPVAIRNLVEWGTQHWQVKPRYLLLVGDASVDIHHDVRKERLNPEAYALRPEPRPDETMQAGGLSNMPTTSYTRWDPDLANRNLIPTWQYASPEGQAASDNGFVTLKPDDFHPTLAVGRLPVIEPAEVKAIVDKTLSYMTHPAPGDWRREVTFVSTDEVKSFKSASDKIAADLGSQGYSIKSLYTRQDASEAAFANAELKKDLNSGNLLVHFLGHGGAYIWRVGPPADLFTLDDVSNLTNTGRYPMVLAMTCFSAPFDNPTEDSIGERFLREADRGAVAVFAASWTNSPNPVYSKALIDQLLEPGQTIGDAIVAAKRGVSDRTFVQMYNLLGDPALVLMRPRGKLQLARGSDRWSDQVIVRVAETGFGGEVDVDWVDLEGNTIQSRRYEARDAQFVLDVPSAKAAEVRVYAGNPRSGYSAIGSLRLIELPKPPPPPRPRPVPPGPVVAPPTAPVQAPPSAPGKAPAPNRAKPLADRIAAPTFEAAPAPHQKAPVAGAVGHP